MELAIRPDRITERDFLRLTPGSPPVLPEEIDYRLGDVVRAILAVGCATGAFNRATPQGVLRVTDDSLGADDDDSVLLYLPIGVTSEQEARYGVIIDGKEDVTAVGGYAADEVRLVNAVAIRGGHIVWCGSARREDLAGQFSGFAWTQDKAIVEAVLALVNGLFATRIVQYEAVAAAVGGRDDSGAPLGPKYFYKVAAMLAAVMDMFPHLTTIDAAVAYAVAAGWSRQVAAAAAKWEADGYDPAAFGRLPDAVRYLSIDTTGITVPARPVPDAVVPDTSTVHG